MEPLLMITLSITDTYLGPNCIAMYISTMINNLLVCMQPPLDLLRILNGYIVWPQ
jgi:hypothetical protein